MADRLILLVEDNPDDEALALRALSKSVVKNRVVVVRDGQEALDWLLYRGAHAHRLPAELPQVILLDLKLPKVDGLEVLRQVRAHPSTRLLPVVILTSSNEDRDVLGCYGSGANSYIRKPVDFTQFTDAVHNLGVYWLLWNQPPPATSGATP